MKLKKKKVTPKKYTRKSCKNCISYLQWELMDSPSGVNQTITPGGRCQNELCHHPLVYADDLCSLWEENTGGIAILPKAEQLKIVAEKA